MHEENFLPEHFINRELSWLEFNARVLEEAQDESNRLLERTKFLAIFASNLDEFFMVRVAGLREQAFGHMPPQDVPADDLGSLEQLQKIAFRTQQLVVQQYQCWNDSIVPALAEENIHFVTRSELHRKQRKSLDKFFHQQVFPVLTPMAIDPSHPSPRFHNRGLYLAALLSRQTGIGPEQLFAVVQIPQVLPRFVVLEPGNEQAFVLLEDLVSDRLPELFGGYDIVDNATFRITRDMDIVLLEQEADDMLRNIESRLRARQRTEAVRLEVSEDINPKLLNMIVGEESIKRNNADEVSGYNEVYTVQGLLDMTSLFELHSLINRDDLRDPPLAPKVPLALHNDKELFEEIGKHDILVHHPYDSFDPVVEFIQRAASDPQVLAIKQTLYRTSGDSPIVRALITAAENGKHVTALVELKARFDEANNIIWARQMERAGVHVVFGFMDLKTHCKLAMVVRQEDKKVRRYVHLGTGNYNPSTARVYTDLGLFTSDQAMADEVSALFNFLTGYSQNHDWQKLIIAPQDLHRKTLEFIDEQAERSRHGKRARIFIKLNSLVDRKTINALYRASQMGVPIDLVIRGICCLRPGLPGISENIHVRSIVDQFLEHSRILVFGEGNKQKLFLSSADWMPRNFERRVEVMFPIESNNLRQDILERIIPAYLHDNSRARVLLSDGTYVRAKQHSQEAIRRSQHELLFSEISAENTAPIKDQSSKSSKRLKNLNRVTNGKMTADSSSAKRVTR
jgi:polyphosphate kinase